MVRRGDHVNKSIIEDWFHMYEQDVTSYLIYYTGSLDVEDLVQETFLIAITKVSNFRKGAHPKTWLISIARNLVIDQYRRHKVWERIKYFLVSEQKNDNVMEKQTIQSQDHQQLYDAIQQLSSNDKEVVIFRGILELSPTETSEIMKTNKNKINVTYHRSLKKLKAILEREGYSFEGNSTIRRES